MREPLKAHFISQPMRLTLLLFRNERNRFCLLFLYSRSDNFTKSTQCLTPCLNQRTKEEEEEGKQQQPKEGDYWYDWAVRYFLFFIFKKSCDQFPAYKCVPLYRPTFLFSQPRSLLFTVPDFLSENMATLWINQGHLLACSVQCEDETCAYTRAGIWQNRGGDFENYSILRYQVMWFIRNFWYISGAHRQGGKASQAISINIVISARLA